MTIINVGNNTYNTYLVKLNTGYLMIDTGYPEGYKHFLKKIKEKKIDCSEISYIFLTHTHDDHAGFLSKLLSNSNAKVILNSEAVIRLKSGKNTGGWLTSRRAVICFKLLEILRKGEHKYPRTDLIDRYIVLNDETRPNVEKTLSAEILDLPGHTKDSVGIFFNDGSLFCGDAAMNGFPSVNRISIFIEDITDYEKSWEAIIKCNPSSVYPGHGKSFPVSDLSGYIKKLKKIKLR